MAYYAILSNNEVVNVIVAEPEFAATLDNLVEYTEENPAGIGWIYDETTGTFTQPPLVEQVTVTQDGS